MYANLQKWPIFNLLKQEFISNIHMVLVFGQFGNEALITTKDEMVYAIGSNESGCLGIGAKQSTLYPVKVEELCGKAIKSFAYGAALHVLTLTEMGEIYGWGCNSRYELGIGSNQAVYTPKLLNLDTGKASIVSIACGGYQSLALTNLGDIYAWGPNLLDEQSNNSRTSQPSTPRKLNIKLGDVKFVYIACGHTFSMALTDNGKVYSWGNNGTGQLGHGQIASLSIPTRVEALKEITIVKVACGYAHSLALTDDGIVYVWGGNCHGELGFFNNSQSERQPLKLKSSEMGRVIDIVALHNAHISVAQGERNRLYMWGHCRGQTVSSPTMTMLTNVYDVFAHYSMPSAMHQPLILHAEDEEEASIMDSLKKAFDDPTTCDLIIKVEGKGIHVHKAILKIRCQYFNKMFQKNWAENKESVIEHDHFSYVVYRSFLKYLYTDKIDESPETAVELLNLANIYLINPLKQICVLRIREGISVENVMYLYVTSIQYNSKELKESCFNFALGHLTEVVQTPNFAKLDEAMVKNFIIEVAQSKGFKT